MRRLAVLALALCFLGPALAGDGPKKPRRKIIVRGHTFPDRVAFLIDGSGSMEGRKYATALKEARRIAEGVSDDGRCRFYVFSDRLSADPQGWWLAPDLDKLDASMAFCRLAFVNGGTTMLPALEEVLRDGMDPLGVIILTDELIEENDGETVATRIRTANGRRKSPAIVGVVGIAGDGRPLPGLGAYVAEATGGTYMSVEPSGPSAGAER